MGERFSVLGHRSFRRSGRRLTIDFVVDGRSLAEQLDPAGEWGIEAGALWAGVHPESNARVVRELLGHQRGGGHEGRVFVYVCPECGQPSCGGYSVRVTRDAGAYLWSDFSLESPVDEPRALPEVGSFRFEANAYERALADAVSALG